MGFSGQPVQVQLYLGRWHTLCKAAATCNLRSVALVCTPACSARAGPANSAVSGACSTC